MRIKKISFGLLPIIMLLLAVFPGITSDAAYPYVFDQADLLDDTEESSLNEKLEKMKSDWNMNFVIVTTEDAGGSDSMNYADDFYDSHYNVGNGGILFLIDMDNRNIYISTEGEGIKYLTDTRIDNILDVVVPYASDGDYKGACDGFISETTSYLKMGYAGKKSLKPLEIIVAFLLALAAGVIPCVIVMAKYQLRFQEKDYNPTSNSAVNLAVTQDQLANTFVTHRVIPKNNGSGSGHSSGGSSTHHSSSGRTHGGGGRSF